MDDATPGSVTARLLPRTSKCQCRLHLLPFRPRSGDGALPQSRPAHLLRPRLPHDTQRELLQVRELRVNKWV